MTNDEFKLISRGDRTACIRGQRRSASRLRARVRHHSSFIIHHSSFRSAFTIIELVVSIGILGILLVVAGGVFTLTLKSSGQANALIEVSQLFRVFEETLGADLRNVQPGRSMMIIQGNAEHAMWTQDELSLAKDSGAGDAAHALSQRRDPEREHFEADEGAVERDLPRADILAFFTDRPATSFRNPQIVAQSQFVVYGHAEIGDLGRDEKWTSLSDMFNADYRVEPATLKFIASGGGPGRYALAEPAHADHNKIGPVAAQDWHLARRAVLIVDQDLDPAEFFPAASLNDSHDALRALGITGNDDDPEYAEAHVSVDDYVRDGRRDYLVNQSAGFDYEIDVTNRQERSDVRGWKTHERDPRTDTDPDDLSAPVNWIQRSQLPRIPLASQADRMGGYFLPRCANFKVEWAVDLSDFDFGACRMPEMPGALEPIWVDPANMADVILKLEDAIAHPASVPGCSGPVFQNLVLQIRNRLVPNDPSDNPGVDAAACIANHRPSRFVEPGPSGNAEPAMRSTHIFYPKNPRPSCFDTLVDAHGDPVAGVVAPPDEPDPLFPKALRITVDVYDAANRLERPIRHVMILPVGQN